MEAKSRVYQDMSSQLRNEDSSLIADFDKSNLE